MTLRQARARLSKIGFTFDPAFRCMDGTLRFGFTQAETVDVGKHHFNPRNRDIYIASCNDGFYVTSHVRGIMRRYRCRHWEPTQIKNIFGGGATLKEAIDKFCANFESKTYNEG